ncbi:ABC transporter substrate-binding protein [Leadbettera azotonutricia]|nr:ABC transporter substrate-binding protein [Leadbettera azotonutricia]
MILIILLGVPLFARGSAQGIRQPLPSRPEIPPGWKPFTIIDMGGREALIERPVQRVYAINLIGDTFIRAIDISKAAGWANPYTRDEKRYMGKYAQLPMLGGWMGSSPTANLEELVKADIDVIFVTAAALKIGPAEHSMADTIQSQTGITTVLISNNLYDTGNALRLMGKVMELEERGELLAAYCDTELAKMETALAKISEKERKRIYYAEGIQGLHTDPSGSSHAQIFDFMRAINVADVEEFTGNGMHGQGAVSLEQVIAWDPEIILRNTTMTQANPSAAVQAILQNPDWAGIKAVKERKVYLTPLLPTNWVDRPPSINRILGMKWLANLFYPDHFSFDMRSEAKEYFRLFYNLELNNEELDHILGNN